MTLIIENVKEEFLPAFKGLAKGVNAKLKAKKNKAEKIVGMERESEEMNTLYKQGKLKTYSSAKEMHADIFNEI
ncbi:hypothetical protein LS70_009705 [Helicobacter sp. MIT 11-5569]|uniref:hypothetical protein n=1 Tax=Helicobacter sp. MIT 11-5569 TaxID=1548151 RepID=UPI00051FD6CF|nr:hypothetical protein [Helicobacter sp. MIT 11-5569]TLD79716.1 hypothetical protein LS70_009705 [Helicobacter sp. MIT 11-5569]